MITAILFDLDETLILDAPVSREAFAAAAEVAAPAGADPARLAADAGGAAKRLWQESEHWTYCKRIGHSAWEGLWARYDQGDDPTIAALHAWAPGYRMAVWREALQLQGITAGVELLAACVARFIKVRRRYPRYPEVDELLAFLAPRYHLGIVTNGVPDLQREKLAGSGIADQFEASVVSGELDCGKPEPGIFRHVCGKLGVEPAACVMVGDNPERDIAGAMAAGMASVWVQRGGRKPDPRFPGDLACTDLRAMLPWLEERV